MRTGTPSILVLTTPCVSALPENRTKRSCNPLTTGFLALRSIAMQIGSGSRGWTRWKPGRRFKENHTTGCALAGGHEPVFVVPGKVFASVETSINSYQKSSVHGFFQGLAMYSEPLEVATAHYGLGFGQSKAGGRATSTSSTPVVTTKARRGQRRTSASSSIPLISGMCRSEMTASNCQRYRAASASSPLLAVAH
jgi:hypothetical protein